MPPAVSPPPPRRLPYVFAVCIVGGLLAVGIVSHRSASAHALEVSKAGALSSVQVIAPTPSPATQELLLPATMQPWEEASIRARSSGYVASWNSDIGTRVAANALLATIVAPELAAQLQQAKDAQATAGANLAIAESTARRWQDMLRTQSISAQDAEQKTADLNARRAELSAAQANATRIAQLVAYTRVQAPFAGTITVRNVDVGTLVDAGGASELFHVARTDRLRVYVAVPDDAANAVAVGDTVSVLAGGRTIAATVTRTSGVLDPATRTLRVEIDIANPDGALMPGAFVQVRMATRQPGQSFEIPVETVLFRPSGPTVATVDGQGIVALKPVRIQRDLGTRLDVAAGLSQQDRIVMNPGDAIVAGARVQVLESTH